MRVFTSSEFRLQSRLIAEQDRNRDLLADLRAAATSRSDYEPHDVTDDEAAIQADAIEARLAAICDALERIESGDYGRCLACGAAIAEERLDAVPTTTVCRACAR
jgi:RNA polymerase-binding transcription factor DksA